LSIRHIAYFPGVAPSQDIFPTSIPSAEACGTPEISLDDPTFHGFAAPQNVPGDLRTYIQGLSLPGEFIIMADIEEMGTISLEAPKDFGDLVAGDFSGLRLNNRQGEYL